MPFDPDSYLNEKMGAKKFDPDAYISQKMEDKPYTNADNPVIQAAIKGAKALDSVTGAPTRAGIAAAQDVGTLNPADWARAGKEAFAKQFAQNPDQAPTGEDIVKKAGVPEGIPSKVAGFGMDMAANPLNFTGPIAAGAGKVVGAAREIPYAGSALGAAIDFPKNAAGKLISKATHLPGKAVEIYSKDPSAVNAFIENTGGEISAGADKMKQAVLDSVQAQKDELSNQIKTALAQANPDRTVPTKPIIDELAKAKSAVNKHTSPADYQHIQSQIDTINNVAPNGQMSLQDLFDVKKYLQSQRYGTLRQPNGDLFLVADSAKKAAGKGLDIARDMLHTEAPAIRDADHVYTQLHDVDNTMSTGLLAQGRAEDMFASAGGATDKYANQHYSALKKIGEITGTNPLKDAELVYAARALNKNPSLLKEAFKTGSTIGQGVTESSIPARTYNLLQVLGAPSDPIARRMEKTHRRLGSE